MTRQKAGLFLAIFIIIGAWILFARHTQKIQSEIPSNNSISETQLTIQDTDAKNRTRSKDPWDVWLEEQTELCVKLVLEASSTPMPVEELNKLRNQIRTNLQARAEELKKESDAPPPLNSAKPEVKETYNTTGKIYSGPQTAEAILVSFYGTYGTEDSRQKQDADYPPEPWLQMILDRGITINSYSEFSGYMAIRVNLGLMKDHVVNNPARAEFKAMLNNLPNPTENWEAFEAAYIDKKIAENQTLNDAMRNDPKVTGGFFTGPNQETFLPLTSNRVYVKKGKTGAAFVGENLSATQKFNLLFRGIEPDRYEIIYIDSNGNTQSEKPQPFKREDFTKAQEDFLNGNQSQPNNDGWEDTWQETQATDAHAISETGQNQTFDRAKLAENEAKALREQGEKALQAAEKYTTMTDEEIEIELNKLLIQNLTDTTPAENFEAELQKHFSLKRLNDAMSLLNRYGPKEGLRRIKERDPEGAALVERILRQKQDTNQ